MSGTIYVLTTPRPRGASYLQQTIAMVEASATWPRVLVVDDTRAPTRDDRGLAFPLAPPSWETVLAPRPDRSAPSNKLAYLRILEHARERGGDALVLEDDVVGCANAVAAMEQAPVSEGAVWLSFFRVGGDNDTPAGYLRGRGRDFVGAQAVKFSGSDVVKLLVGADLHERVLQSTRAHFAEALAEIANHEGWAYDLAYPGVVQHAGDVSAVDPDRRPGPHIRSRAFVGLSADALKVALPTWQLIA